MTTIAAITVGNMEWKDIAAYLTFHSPFFVLAYIIWIKCKSRVVARSVVAVLILSHLIALAASFGNCCHDDDTPLILHVGFLYAIAPPLIAWVFVVLPKAKNVFWKPLATAIAAYLCEVAVFFVTFCIYFWICPFQFK